MTVSETIRKALIDAKTTSRDGTVVHASMNDVLACLTAALSDQVVAPKGTDQIEQILPMEVEITGPYHYDGDKHPCLRIATADRIVACVYIVDDDESRAFSEAQMIKEAFRLGGKEIDRLHYLSGSAVDNGEDVLGEKA